MKKGFALIELLVVIAIVGIFITIFIAGGNSLKELSKQQREAAQVDSFLYPEQAKVRALEDQAKELKRANDLKERELRLLESKK